MEMFNVKALLLAAVANMVIGSIWYNPKVFGTMWMKEIGKTEEDLKGANMLILFGTTFVFALMLSTAIMPIVVHQMHLGSICMNQLQGTDEAAKVMAQADIDGFMGKYGNEFRTFKHGAFHGLLTSIFFILPIIGTISLFERRSWKYIFIHVGYWAVNLMVMGGIICGWVA